MACLCIRKNMGTTDRILRAVAGVVAVVLGVTMMGSWGSLVSGIVIAVGAVFLLTAACRFCPAYVPLKLSTCGGETCCGGENDGAADACCGSDSSSSCCSK